MPRVMQLNRLITGSLSTASKYNPLEYVEFMKNVLAIALLLSIAHSSIAGERVIADDGREVMLGDDGQWEFLSEDRFATTASGERVRLKADGEWDIVSDAPLGQLTAAQPVANMGPANWSLAEVTIETAREQRSASKKSISKQTQTVFNLEARMKTADADTEQWMLNVANLSVMDSGGREYPVLSITPGSISLTADAPAKVQIRVDGSPHWFTTRYYELKIAEQTVGNREEIRLKRALSNVQKRDVEELP